MDSFPLFLSGALVLSGLTITFTPEIASRANNPVLSFSLVLLTLTVLYRVWKATFHDAQVAAFHGLVSATNLVIIVKDLCSYLKVVGYIQRFRLLSQIL